MIVLAKSEYFEILGLKQLFLEKNSVWFNEK